MGFCLRWPNYCPNLLKPDYWPNLDYWLVLCQTLCRWASLLFALDHLNQHIDIRHGGRISVKASVIRDINWSVSQHFLLDISPIGLHCTQSFKLEHQRKLDAMGFTFFHPRSLFLSFLATPLSLFFEKVTVQSKGQGASLSMLSALMRDVKCKVFSTIICK